jgi:hypothetical protein
MLVQAKALDHLDHQYPEIGRFIGRSKTNPKTRQIDQLIKTAKKLNFPAVYAFYNHLNDLRRIPSRCRSLAMIGATVPESWGISFAPADKVASVLADQTFDTHCQHSIPFHCLICTGGTGKAPPEGSPGIIARAFRLSSTPSLGRRRKMRPNEDGTWQIRHPIFDLAYEASRSEHGDEESPLIVKLRKQFPRVAGVVIVRDPEPSPRDEQTP